MPHPEAYNHFTNHPDWTRRREKLKRQKKSIDPGPAVGVRIFQNAVAYFQ
jgi:phosphoribosylformylglycinamidine synthase